MWATNQSCTSQGLSFKHQVRQGLPDPNTASWCKIPITLIRGPFSPHSVLVGGLGHLPLPLLPPLPAASTARAGSNPPGTAPGRRAAFGALEVGWCGPQVATETHRRHVAGSSSGPARAGGWGCVECTVVPGGLRSLGCVPRWQVPRAWAQGPCSGPHHSPQLQLLPPVHLPQPPRAGLKSALAL